MFFFCFLTAIFFFLKKISVWNPTTEILSIYYFKLELRFFSRYFKLQNGRFSLHTSGNGSFIYNSVACSVSVKFWIQSVHLGGKQHYHIDEKILFGIIAPEVWKMEEEAEERGKRKWFYLLTHRRKEDQIVTTHGPFLKSCRLNKSLSKKMYFCVFPPMLSNPQPTSPLSS